MRGCEQPERSKRRTGCCMLSKNDKLRRRIERSRILIPIRLIKPKLSVRAQNSGEGGPGVSY